MADDADKAPEAAVSTPGDAARDGAQEAARQVARDGSGDRAPRKRGRPKGSKNAKPAAAKGTAQENVSDEAKKQEQKELRALKKKIAGLLSGPAMMLEPWPAGHVEEQAPELAGAIIKLAEDDPVLRRRLLKFFEGGAVGNLIAMAVMYSLPVLVYYGAPAPPIVKRAFHVPDRRQYLAERGEPVPLGQMMPEPAPEDMEREAIERGFVSVEQYVQGARQTGSWDIKAIRAYAPPSPGSSAPDS